VPYTPPINLRELQKKGFLDEKRFFMLLSQHCNYVAPEAIKDFYMGLVRYITKEIRENGMVRLPHLGDFALTKQKSKIGWAGKYQTILPSKYVLKFYPSVSWRKYFTEFSEKAGPDGGLDPREKILKKKI